ncbi:MAG: asparagine synthase (glutamine-hydrolyzing) [Firmicutes bacterium]|nr:asparagine synthase (glutamine-hydrolyzing) [Bacillota bacterium]
MCGICGIFSHAGGKGEVSRPRLLKMRDSMVHRGPDDAGLYISEDRVIGLGHRRLSIVDLAGGGQPMGNEDGSIWIVFNGEIYNHAELRRDLEKTGHKYRTRSDTETIIHLYEEKGTDCLQGLRGMFAFAIWDSRQRRLFLARDRIGVKPLYYAWHDGKFLFASEIKAILEYPGISRDVDPVALYHYLTFVATPPPRTLFNGIQKLAAGHFLVVESSGRITESVYWDAVVAKDLVNTYSSEEEYAERLLELLEESIRLRMMSDVPFGVFLSGGIDSSSNVALMAKALDRPVETFTVGYRGDETEGYNELDHARHVAGLFGARHHEVIISSDELIGCLPQLVYQQDEPVADPVNVPLYHVAKLARDSGVVVAQVGEGSDELFCGYEHFIKFLRFQAGGWERFRRWPAFLQQAVYQTGRAALGSRREYHKLDTIRRAVENEELFWGGAIAFSETEKRLLLSEGFKRRSAGLSSFDVVKEYYERFDRQNPDGDFLQRMTYLELKLRLPELLLMRVDKMTMATSVEARVPFLDHKLVEFALNIPTGFKIKGGPKHILKRALAGVLPDEVIHRKKLGFGVPVKEWFKGELTGQIEAVLTRSRIRERDFFDYKYVSQLLQWHREGRRDSSFALWNLFTLALWYDYWIEKDPLPFPYLVQKSNAR